MSKLLKWALVIGGIGILIYGLFWIFAIVSFAGGFDKSYSYQDLIENYNNKTKEILELKNYINNIVPVEMSVDIEFDGNNKFNFFHVVDNGNYYSNWDLILNSTKTDSLLLKLSWTKEILKKLKAKLDSANCISVKSGDPCNIGFKRSGMGKYYYNLFDKPITDSLKRTYNDSCTYILYNDNVVFEYGGGAIGPQCFPEFKHDGH